MFALRDDNGKTCHFYVDGYATDAAYSLSRRQVLNVVEGDLSVLVSSSGGKLRCFEAFYSDYYSDHAQEYLRIGCHRFYGKDARKILRWARTTSKRRVK
jgi:hypothetical protein